VVEEVARTGVPVVEEVARTGVPVVEEVARTGVPVVEEVAQRPSRDHREVALTWGKTLAIERMFD